MIPIYWGIFVPILGGELERVVVFKHVTYGFKTEYPMWVHGKPADVKIIGYGNDGQNEAYLVKLPKWTEDIYRGSSIKHITLSVSRNGKPIDSCHLEFKPIEPFIVEGVFGYFDGQVHLD